LAAWSRALPGLPGTGAGSSVGAGEELGERAGRTGSGCWVAERCCSRAERAGACSGPGTLLSVSLEPTVVSTPL